ncbi:MAG: hypothetical protein AAGA10_23815 [Bacteroidota bacterium]
MKKWVQIGSMVGAGYFLALPILFALHFLSHHESCAHVATHKVDGQFTLVEDSEDCDFCDLYFKNHPTIHTLTPLPSTFLAGKAMEIHFILFSKIALRFYFLRGPPLFKG